jgi:hypothetical protein
LERLTFAAWGQLDIAACIRGACLLDTEHGCPASGHELQFSSMMVMVMVMVMVISPPCKETGNTGWNGITNSVMFD